MYSGKLNVPVGRTDILPFETFTAGDLDLVHVKDPAHVKSATEYMVKNFYQHAPLPAKMKLFELAPELVQNEIGRYRLSFLKV